MRIEFTNAKLTVAIITRTRWSWRRFAFFCEWAEVEWSCEDLVWFYTSNGLQVEWLQGRIHRAVLRETARRKVAAIVKHATEHPPAWREWEASMGHVLGDRL